MDPEKGPTEQPRAVAFTTEMLLLPGNCSSVDGLLQADRDHPLQALKARVSKAQGAAKRNPGCGWKNEQALKGRNKIFLFIPQYTSHRREFCIRARTP